MYLRYEIFQSTRGEWTTLGGVLCNEFTFREETSIPAIDFETRNKTRRLLFEKAGSFYGLLKIPILLQQRAELFFHLAAG